MRKGWFKIAGVQDGDRTMEEQRLGLAAALAGARGKSVLDLGSAEGLIAREFARFGARKILGVEIVSDHVKVARELVKGLPIELVVGDIADEGMDYTDGGAGWDIVLMLAVLHKTRAPAAVLERFARLTRELLVIRLPGGAADGVYSHARRGNALVDVAKILAGCGFVLERTERGPSKDCGLEPVLYFRRKAA